MREIKFRGKRIDNGEWVYGSVLIDEENNEAYIAEYFEDKSAYIREVNPETVGQYTGLCDKNGKEIYEGDQFLFDGEVVSETIYWHEEDACWAMKKRSRFGVLIRRLNDHSCLAGSVIGNKWENPELLEVGEGCK